MKRWHVTLGLVVLAGAGLSLAGAVPLVGAAGWMLVPARSPLPERAPLAASSVELAEPDAIATPPAPPEVPVVAVPPATPAAPPVPRDGVHELHPAPRHAPPPLTGIPEVRERPPRPPVVLPPDPPEPRDCPGCGRG